MSNDHVTELTQKWVPQIEAALTAAFPADRHPHLNPAVAYHLATGGKRLRPVLCLATCEQLGGDPSEALTFAAAAEIMHNMFLVHDDLEDGDEVRRDQPTLWKKFGAANAVNCGDYMIGRAFRMMLDTYRDKKILRPHTRPLHRNLRTHHRRPGRRHEHARRRDLHHRTLPQHHPPQDRLLPRFYHDRRGNSRGRRRDRRTATAQDRPAARPGLPDTRRRARPHAGQGPRRHARLRHTRRQTQHTLRLAARCKNAPTTSAPRYWR